MANDRGVTDDALHQAALDADADATLAAETARRDAVTGDGLGPDQSRDQAYSTSGSRSSLSLPSFSRTSTKPCDS